MEEQVTVQPVPLPRLVRVIATLYMIGAAFGIIGAATIIGAGLAFGKFSPFTKYGTTGALMLLALAGIAFLLSRGLRRRRPWARKVAIIISILSIVVSFMQSSLGTPSMPSVIFSLFVALYLLLARPVRVAFAGQAA